MRRFFSAFEARARPPENQLLESTVGAEGDRLSDLLANTAPADLSPDQVRAEVEGNLWMLTPEAFLYFLPAFMSLAVEHYDSLGYFAAELVAALTEPTRDDVLQSLDRAEQIPADMGLTQGTLHQLRQQQLEWFDSGKPLATYQNRVKSLSAEESAAILDFLVAIRDAHGSDFPFHEPEIAVERHLARRL